MDKIGLKLFAADSSSVGEGDFVPVFHGWIQRHAVDGHMLIDVADYAHVHHGPGTVLVAHEGNFSTDRAGGRLGLLYTRKQPLARATLADQIRTVVTIVLKACATLEQEPTLAGRLTFRTDEMMLRINDRLAGPNTRETLALVKPALDAVLAELYPGARTTVRHEPSPRVLFDATITASESPSVATLLGRLGVEVAAPVRA